MSNRALELVRSRYADVTKVVDAKKPLEIEVTAADLAKAKTKDHQNCALAQACKRAFDGAIVSLSTAYVVRGKTATRYVIPPTVSREIVAFDRSGGFIPGEYHFNAPPLTERLGNRKPSRGKGGTHGKPNGKLKKRFKKLNGERGARPSLACQYLAAKGAN